MQANKTVTINGRTYDAVTGMPVTKAAKKPSPAPAQKKQPAVPSRASSTTASSIHATQQRSQTLHRRAAKKPTPAKRPQAGRHMDIAGRSTQISRFAPHPVTLAKPKADERPSTPDKAPQKHPMVHKALAKAPTRSSTTKTAPLSSKQIKEAAISQALAKPTVKPKKEKKAVWWRSQRFIITTAIFIMLIGGAFLIYVSIPNISVQFAAMQAGISAKYPDYQPDGYRLSQPVTFSEKEVVLKFISNNGPTGYTITQTSSTWESGAVLENIVKKAVGSDYTTTQEKGLTIYTYRVGDNASAVWVNGGLLYKIESTAPLSGEQIRRIATSL